MSRLVAPLLAALTLAIPVAYAQPAPPDTRTKDDAKALLQSGLKLFAAKDYLGALAVFRDGYARFPSATFLLNIGTTLSRLDRKAEAANAYQRYLDAPDAVAKKKQDVAAALAELDRSVAVLELAVTPAGAEVQIASGEWLPVTAAARYRVDPGPVVVRARAPRHEPAEQTVTAAAGAKLPVELALVAIAAPAPAPGPSEPATDVASGVTATVAAEPRARFGALVRIHGDVVNPGAAALVGAAFDVTSRLQVQAAALLGATFGGYAGASFAVLETRVRPIVVAGFPIYVSDGARVAVRGGAGVDVPLGRHVSVIAELGVEHVFDPEPGVTATLFVPALGVIGRL
ncbi:MAG TPA: tetratricopeptide repeat protein [Kofleriaceae bacterium]|nr:tetratricopeptide repeat protein [Kofleriaceae bacterium]